MMENLVLYPPCVNVIQDERERERGEREREREGEREREREREFYSFKLFFGNYLFLWATHERREREVKWMNNKFKQGRLAWPRAGNPF